jgi:hypothetical protein
MTIGIGGSGMTTSIDEITLTHVRGIFTTSRDGPVAMAILWSRRSTATPVVSIAICDWSESIRGGARI